MSKSRAADPASAAQLEQLFASTDVLGQAGRIMDTLGLSKNNAADAFAVYWIAAWQASFGEMEDRSAETYRAVARQAAAGLSQAPEFTGASNAQKQEMAEALIVQTVLTDNAKEQAASDPEQLRAVGDAIKRGAKATGLDLDTMTLTEGGFVSSTKTGDAGSAIDRTAPAKQDAAFAMSGTADAGSDDTDGDLSATQLALIAAAVTAGLGGAYLLGKNTGKG